MIITVTEIGQEKTESKGARSWKVIVVKYTGDQGDKEKTFRSFGPDYKFARQMEEGKTYNVGLRKDGNFWVWSSVEEADGSSPRAATSGGEGKPNGSTGYWDEKFNLDKERFAFDKEKQPLIVRQSCIGYAVDYLKTAAPNAAVDDVLDVARRFESYVFSSGAEELKDMEVE